MNTFTRFGLFLAVFISFANANAQDDTRISVVAGEQPISEQLTEEQKACVTHLDVTGHLTDADYGFFRKTKLNKLTELNLQDVDNDTIPTQALSHDYRLYFMDLPVRRVILPKCLKHIEKDALCIGCGVCQYEVTDRFPTIESQHEPSYGRNLIVASPDNQYCINRDDMIFSADADTLFYCNTRAGQYGNYQIPEGIKVIAGRALAELLLYESSTITIPSTVDSIGANAFSDILVSLVCSNAPSRAGSINVMCVLKCYAANPPKLGSNVFADRYPADNYFLFTLVVPDESVDLYKNTDDWKNFSLIWPQSREKELNPGGTDVAEVDYAGKPVVSTTENGYSITTESPITAATVYNITGQKIASCPCNGNTVNIACPHSAAYILRLSYDDGRTETIKLK